jgi:hypothetical protein
VAGGGILGYLNIDRPSTRFLRASFAVKRSAPRPWNDDQNRENLDWTPHMELLPLKYAKYEPGVDGMPYAFDRLVWFAHAGDAFLPDTSFTYESNHHFPSEDDDVLWIASEQLWYSSDGGKVSWYKYNHKENAGAAVLGTVSLDMTRLQEHQAVLPIIVGLDSKQYYKIRLLVEVQMLEGFRHELRITARWADDNTTNIEKIMGADINIAAAFKVTAV